jgi:hypothetical protein
MKQLGDPTKVDACIDCAKGEGRPLQGFPELHPMALSPVLWGLVGRVIPRTGIAAMENSTAMRFLARTVETLLMSVGIWGIALLSQRKFPSLYAEQSIVIAFLALLPVFIASHLRVLRMLRANTGTIRTIATPLELRDVPRLIIVALVSVPLAAFVLDFTLDGSHWAWFAGTIGFVGLAAGAAHHALDEHVGDSQPLMHPLETASPDRLGATTIHTMFAGTLQPKLAISRTIGVPHRHGGGRGLRSDRLRCASTCACPRPSGEVRGAGRTCSGCTSDVRGTRPCGRVV